MPVLVFIIIFSLALYVYFKVKYVRSRRPAERLWLTSKSGIALGTFVMAFGINQLFLFQTTVTYIVAAIFIFLGAINIWSGIKSYKFYLPHAIKEAEGENS
ncbi:hypothetical protein A8F94_05820 [Bacillus sp. FJAT-27225]|uniref:YtpI family protein n=1 Tax=Bacillus sp. FJAT-27225 TaxID=1743144 RepID=UPI00080C3383|nr:YtpI family protein [Bacillus sp. FJAT-27225]OCA91374.1 hypothetical protein A8F94_05820 [Bacillus sp. FJAT-27225]